MSRLALAWLPAGLALLSACATVNKKTPEAPVAASTAAAAAEDPYLWLEDVGGDTALDWVRGHAAARRALAIARWWLSGTARGVAPEDRPHRFSGAYTPPVRAFTRR